MRSGVDSPPDPRGPPLLAPVTHSLKVETLMRKRFLLIPAALVAAACNVDQPTGLRGPIDPGTHTAYSGMARRPSAVIPDAALPQPVTITVTVHHDFEAGTVEGTWEATGAITDQGTVEWTRLVFEGGPPIFSAGQVFAKAILSSARGSFEMHSREHLTSAPDPQNTWVVGHGVGFYEGLQGEGTMTVTRGTE